MTDATRDPGSDASLESRYSNYVEVGFNAFEFLFAFGQAYSESELAKTHTKIVMSPHYARNLLETLQTSLSQYEKNYGVVVNKEMAAEPIPTIAAAEAGRPLSRLAAMPTASGNRALVIPAPAAPSPQPLNDAITALLNKLKTYLPVGGGGSPNPGVSLASVTERSLGLNNRRGEDTRAGYPVVELKGVRVDAVARFELWAPQPDAVEQAIQSLIAKLLADRDALWIAGFLKLALNGISASENVPAINAWRQTADVSVLFEYQFTDFDDSQGLIAKIPIKFDPPFPDQTTVSDDMTRWDDTAAQVLAVRGPINIGALTALVFIAGAAPSRTVTLTRTFDEAQGPPVSFSTFAAFLAAISGPNPQRNAVFVFPSWSAFAGIFSPAGSAVTLGTDSYSPLEFSLGQVIPLGGVEDVFKIAYQNAALEVTAVVYLRAQ